MRENLDDWFDITGEFEARQKQDRQQILIDADQERPLIEYIHVSDEEINDSYIRDDAMVSFNTMMLMAAVAMSSGVLLGVGIALWATTPIGLL